MSRHSSAILATWSEPLRLHIACSWSTGPFTGMDDPFNFSLEEGRGDEQIPGPWTVTTVGPNAAVKLRYVDGTETFFVVEPDIALRRLDADSWEPNHALARCLAGYGTGEAFTGPDGREGTIIQVTHKYVARLHHVMEHHSTRFPEIFGFKSVTVDFEQPNGLDGLIAQLKARHDWITREEESYVNGFMLLGVLADRVGADTIDVSGGLALAASRSR